MTPRLILIIVQADYPGHAPTVYQVDQHPQDLLYDLPNYTTLHGLVGHDEITKALKSYEQHHGIERTQ